MKEMLIHCTRWVTMQPLNSEGNIDSLHKVGYNAASEE